MTFTITATQGQKTVRWNNYWEESDLPWCKRYKTRKIAEASIKRLANNRDFKKAVNPVIVQE